MGASLNFMIAPRMEFESKVKTGGESELQIGCGNAKRFFTPCHPGKIWK